jgi:hypothetical protein
MMLENFNSAYYQMNLLYGTELSPEEFEEIGLIAWHKIGNRRTRLYRYVTDIQCPDNTVDLPCNCDIIEAVTYGFEEWNYVTNDTVNGDYSSQFTENYIESRKLYSDPLYISGKYAKFERVGDTLYFEKNYGQVNILYKGILVDEDGLPEINYKEKDAIACYCACTKRFKEGWKNHNQNMLQEAQLLEQRWLKLCDAARVSIHLSQNDMNEILDAKTSWNRKIFNKSYKPLR